MSREARSTHEIIQKKTCECVEEIMSTQENLIHTHEKFRKGVVAERELRKLPQIGQVPGDLECHQQFLSGQALTAIMSFSFMLSFELVSFFEREFHKIATIIFPFLQVELTPLHCAAWKGHHEMCQSLLEHGANADAQDKVKRECVPGKYIV